MSRFQVIPSIDLRGGKCVRLFQGDYARETTYSDDPIATARRWEAEGGPLLHVVDLDGAKSGRPENAAIIAQICATLHIPVEVSGGLRTMSHISAAFAYGAGRVQLGSVAIRDPELVALACTHYPGRVIVSIDAKNGEVMTDGWTAGSGKRALDLAHEMVALGVPRLMYTDIARDGTGTGPNLEALREMVERAGVPVIASGGITTMAQLRAVKAAGCECAILGRALYEGEIDLAAAVKEVG